MKTLHKLVFDLSAVLIRHFCGNSCTGGVDGATLTPDPLMGESDAKRIKNPNELEITVNAKVDIFGVSNLISHRK